MQSVDKKWRLAEEPSANDEKHPMKIYKSKESKKKIGFLIFIQTHSTAKTDMHPLKRNQLTKELLLTFDNRY